MRSWRRVARPTGASVVKPRYRYHLWCHRWLLVHAYYNVGPRFAPLSLKCARG